MRNLYDKVSIKTMFLGPSPHDSFIAYCGIKQCVVHVKQDRVAAKFDQRRSPFQDVEVICVQGHYLVARLTWETPFPGESSPAPGIFAWRQFSAAGSWPHPLLGRVRRVALRWCYNPRWKVVRWLFRLSLLLLSLNLSRERGASGGRRVRKDVA